MVDADITIEEQSTQYLATIESHIKSTLYVVKYTGRLDGRRCTKKPRAVDLNLPPLETASLWREGGYHTDAAQENSGAEEELSGGSDGANSDDEEMARDSDEL